jgi:GNAT superfamily N-acetyltransferase
MQLNPWIVRFALTENLHDSLQFLRKRGYAEEWRSYESCWDIRQFDPAQFDGIDEKLNAGGIVIKTYAEFADDPNRDTKLYELSEDTRADTAFIEPLTRNEYGRWRDMCLDGYRANTDAFFVAARDGEYVGIAMLAKAEAGANIDTRWVGVRRDMRGQGIAMGLKKRMFNYARAHDHPRITTVTNSKNAPVIAMNQKLGYIDQPAWVYYSKTLRKEKP